MCGIYGSVGFEPEPERLDRVAHRGPDGRGWRTFESHAGPVALGHRRLAIIDVSDAGLQPMNDASGRYHLVYNGELYNYLELRDELRARGEVFSSQSDTEVLLRAYMVWGPDALSRFRGMFAFLIWDNLQKVLFAARDRYGIKPLYVADTAMGLAFGSEIKQLVGLPGLSGRMNIARVHDFLASGISDHTDETLFDGIDQVRGGECLLADLSTGSIVTRRRRWYAIDTGETAFEDEEAAERFRALLEESVRLHLRSDVPVGSCLSGGLDSSSIVCLMAREPAFVGGTTINTVSACYTEKSVNEKPFMEAVIGHVGARGHYLYPRADDVFQKASDLTWYQDEPFGSTSIFAQWCVFDVARQIGVKVMLDGQGADEQLAGYHNGFHYYLAMLLRQGQLTEAYRTLISRRDVHGTPIGNQLARAMVPLLAPGMQQMVRDRRSAITQHDWLGTELIRSRGNAEGAQALASRLLDLPDVRDIRTLCLNQTFASNLQMLLHWEDRNSMAHGIEARVPFLDHPLVEFSLALGNSHKFKGAETKRVLRHAMRGVLPEAVRMRQDKLGFATPEETWFRGPLKGRMTEGVEATLALYPEIFNAEGTRRLAQEMLDGRRRMDFALWRIVNLGIWGQRFGITL